MRLSPYLEREYMRPSLRRENICWLYNVYIRVNARVVVNEEHARVVVGEEHARVVM